MFVTPFGITTLLSLLSLQKAYELIAVNPSCNSTVSRLVQPLNVYCPIVLTPEGIDIFVISVQYWNAYEPIEVNVVGRLNLFIIVQFWNA